MRSWIKAARPVVKRELFTRLMERPLVWKAECADALKREIKAGRVVVEGKGDGAVLRPVAA